MNRRRAPSRNVGDTNLFAAESQDDEDSSLQGNVVGSNRAILLKSLNSKKTNLTNNLVSVQSAMGDSLTRKPRINIPEKNSRVRKKKDRRKNIHQKVKDLIKTKLNDNRIPVVRICRIDSVDVLFKSKSTIKIKELINSDKIPKEQEKSIELNDPHNINCAKNEAKSLLRTEKCILNSENIWESCSIRLTRTFSNNEIIQHDRNVFQEEKTPVQKEKHAELKEDDMKKQDLSVNDQINKIADKNVPQDASLFKKKSRKKYEKSIKENWSQSSSNYQIHLPVSKSNSDQQITLRNRQPLDKSNNNKQVNYQNKELLDKSNIDQQISLQDQFPLGKNNREQQISLRDRQSSINKSSCQQIILKNQLSLRNPSSKETKRKILIKDPVENSAKRRYLDSNSSNENIVQIVGEEKNNVSDTKNFSPIVIQRKVNINMPAINKDEELLSKFKITKQLVVQLLKDKSMPEDKTTCTADFPSVSQGNMFFTKELSSNSENIKSYLKESSEAEETILSTITGDCNEDTKRSRPLTKTKNMPRAKQWNSRRENMENKSIRHNNNNNDNVNNNNQKCVVSNSKDENFSNVLKVYNVSCNKQSEEHISHLLQEIDTKLPKNNSHQESGKTIDSLLTLELKKGNKTINKKITESQINVRLEEKDKITENSERNKRKISPINNNHKIKAINVVTPRRITMDKVEADQSQDAKLQMLMNATTPSEAISQQLVNGQLDVFSRKVKSKPLTEISSLSRETKGETEISVKCSSLSELQFTTIEEANQAEIENINNDEIVINNKINGICNQPEMNADDVTDLQCMKIIDDIRLTKCKYANCVETEQRTVIKINDIKEKVEIEKKKCKITDSNNEVLNENSNHTFSDDTNIKVVINNNESISNQPINNDSNNEINDLVCALTNSDYANIKNMSCPEIFNNQIIEENVLNCVEDIVPGDKGTCLACKGVVDLIERLEMSLEMSEEEKPTVLCPYCTNNFQSLYYLEYHIKQVHIQCENEKLCRHSKYTWLDLSIREAEMESYVTKSLKCRNCYQLYETVAEMNEHLLTDHKNLVYQKTTNELNICFAAERRGRGRRKKNTLNGKRNVVVKPNFECPEGCVCRMFAIPGCDTNEHMLNGVHKTHEIPKELKRLEIAADEVYCCVLCKSIFLLKDEVFNHLLKLHDIACKYPCFSCLISFRNLERKENHKCMAQKFFNLNELLSVTILPLCQNRTKESFGQHNVRDIQDPLDKKACLTNCNLLKNGIKCNSLYDSFLKQSNLNDIDLQLYACPKCTKKFSSKAKLHEHRFFFHNVHVNKKTAKNILAPVTRANKRRAGSKINNTDISTCPKNSIGIHQFLTPDEQENTKDHEGLVQNSSVLTQNSKMQCSKCNSVFKKFANFIRHGYIAHKEDNNVHICDNCAAIMTSVSMVNDHVCKKVDTFDCLRCNESFLNGLELKKHNRTVHFEKTGPHACTICKKCFLTNRMLEKHMRIHHTNSIKFNDPNKSKEKEESQNISVNSVDLSSTSLDERRDSSNSVASEEVMNCNCLICGFSCSSNVSLKNHLKREHRRKVSICQLCNNLILDISDVRHMLEHHIIPSISNASQEHLSSEDSLKEDVNKLIKTLGKERIRSLIVYQDFEGKSNNEIMKCPECSQSFTSYQICRQHYLWTHDLVCLLCDETFRSASNAFKHKVDSHNSAASYIWCIQRLVTAIMGTLHLDETKKSNILFQILCTNLEVLEAGKKEVLQVIKEKEKDEPEKLFQVLSEDQLPDPTNMIEVVIGREDSEDDLLSLLNLSPNYEGVERLPKTDVEPPEENVFDDKETEKPNDVSGSIIETFISSGICKYRLDQDGKGGIEEQPVLVVTDEDLVTYKDDISSLALRISSTCDILGFEEITDMLEAYFHNVHNT